MGCCCSKRRRYSSSAFGGDGHRLGTADEQRDARAARAAAAEKRFTDKPSESEPYTDDNLTDAERAKIREERLAAAEARMTKHEKQAMKQKKKPTSEPLRGPNSRNAMQWTAG